MMRRIAATAAVVVALAALGACGGGDGDADPTPTTTGGGAAAGPVTVEHRYGTTTVEAPPRRIVSLDNQWTDVLVALDAPLVGAALDPSAPDGRWPWQDRIPADVEGIAVTDSTIPFEAVAALDPDLIVITWFAQGEQDYERLSQIAPTIPLLGDEQVDRWQDIASVAGQVLRDEAGARRLVDEADRRVEALRRELPGLEGRTYALANYVPGDAIYVVADPDDGASELFAALGMEIDPELLALAGGASGRVELSLERIGELDSDLLVLLTNGADPDTIPGFADLPAVRSGAVALLDLASISGLNTPSPLSIPYSLDRLRPTLEAAAT